MGIIPKLHVIPGTICHFCFFHFFPLLGSYFAASLNPLLESLRRKVAQGRNVPNGCTRAWVEWLETWSDTSVETLLCSNPSANLRSKFGVSESDLFEQLSSLLPWTEDAVAARGTCDIPFPWSFSAPHVALYIVNGFWPDAMHTYKGGLKSLATSFLEKNTCGWNEDVELNQTLRLGITVRKIHYDDKSVVVTAFDNLTEAEIEITGDAVIVTTPIVNVLQMEFTPPLPREYRDAFSVVPLYSCLKVLMQCKTRFWEKQGISGGATSVTLPSGFTLEIIYPTILEAEDGNQTKGGILMCYLWRTIADHYAEMPEDVIVKEIMGEISHIHPELASECEQGTAHVFPKEFTVKEPLSYQKVLMLMNYNVKGKLHFTGESLSWVASWIEGALQSGLRTAFQFYLHNELTAVQSTPSSKL